MKFKLEITCDNAAFGDGMTETNAEVSRILKSLAHSLIIEGYGNGPLRDWNGNTVGKYAYEGKRDDDNDQVD